MSALCDMAMAQQAEVIMFQIEKGLSLTSFSHSELGSGHVDLEMLSVNWMHSLSPGKNHSASKTIPSQTWKQPFSAGKSSKQSNVV